MTATTTPTPASPSPQRSAPASVRPTTLPTASRDGREHQPAGRRPVAADGVGRRVATRLPGRPDVAAASCRSRTSASTARTHRGALVVNARRRGERRADLRRGCTRSGSRSGGCCRSRPTAATTTRAWPPTTPPPSTAASPARRTRRARSHRTPTAARSTSTRGRTRGGTRAAPASSRTRTYGTHRSGPGVVSQGRRWRGGRSRPRAGSGRTAPRIDFQHFDTGYPSRPLG